MRAVLLALLLLGACTGSDPEKPTNVTGEGTAAGDCTDKADNDGDTLVDCDDEGCAGSLDCVPEVDPSKEDVDGDGLSTTEEDEAGTDPLVADTDGDGRTDGEELADGTNPLDPDSDDDGRNDGQEFFDDTDPNDDDSDDDGRTDGEEFADGTDPNDDDSDDDGRTDGEEHAASTYALDADSDNDGRTDGEEFADGTDPLDDDSDDDGRTDGEEFLDGTSPLDDDSDDDGRTDGQEATDGTDPLDTDSDDDGRTDGQEAIDGTDPLDTDSDDDGRTDGQEATDGTNPLDDDSDDDGRTDGQEATDGTDPLDTDSDDDGLSDSDEVLYQTDPLDADSDGDNKNDGDEVSGGSDPLAADLFATHTVCATGGDHTTIQAAIDAAQNGDVIGVCAGVYAESLDAAGVDFTLFGIDGAAATRIEPPTDQTGLAVMGGENVRLHGLTFAGARTDDAVLGGGLSLGTGADVTIEQCVFDDNVGKNGGAIHAMASTLTIRDVAFTDNTSPNPIAALFLHSTTSDIADVSFTGAGIYSYEGPLDLTNMTVRAGPVWTVNNAGLVVWARGEHRADASHLAFYDVTGTAISVPHPGRVTIQNFLIAGGVGLGVNLIGDSADRRASLTLANGTIVGRTTAVLVSSQIDFYEVRGIAAINNNVGFASQNAPLGTFEDCALYGNATRDFSDNIIDRPGMVYADPLFMNFSDDADWSNDDFRLSPGSPLIDAGYHHVHYRDPDGSRNDIGAYGGPGGDW